MVKTITLLSLLSLVSCAGMHKSGSFFLRPHTKSVAKSEPKAKNLKRGNSSFELIHGANAAQEAGSAAAAAAMMSF